MTKIDFNSPLVVTWYDNDGCYEGDESYYTKHYEQHVSVLDLYNEIKNEYSFERNYNPIFIEGECDSNGEPLSDEIYNIALARGLKAYEEGKNGTIVDDVVLYINEGDCGHVRHLDDYNTDRIEYERKKLEKIASKYAAMFNTTLGSWSFVRALQEYRQSVEDKLDVFNNEENRAERWATHMYHGCTSEFFENEEYGNCTYYTILSELDMIEKWLHTNCPLLMASWTESELKELKTEICN